MKHVPSTRLALVFGLGALLFVGCGGGSSSGSGGAGASGGSGGAGGSGGSGGSGGGVSYPDAYTIVAFDDTRITSDGSQPNFQTVFADVDFKDGPFASAKLVVDLASTCYPFDNWLDNPPPSGQNWPADCDAFDRNFDISLDDPVDPAVDGPGLELMHAITPFGGPMHLEIDVTDVANGLPGNHRIRAHITTWSDGAGQVSGSNGGWNVTARLEMVPGAAPRNVLAVKSLFYGTQTTAEGPGELAFDAPEGTTSGRIELKTSGHGGGDPVAGCIGPAEEFCNRTHSVSIDGALVEAWKPWRTDCKDLCTETTHTWPSGSSFNYCMENPCGAISSVKAPRANWCPGSMTPPKQWETPELGKVGPHTFQWVISTVAPGGSWATSATYFAYGP